MSRRGHDATIVPRRSRVVEDPRGDHRDQAMTAHPPRTETRRYAAATGALAFLESGSARRTREPSARGGPAEGEEMGLDHDGPGVTAEVALDALPGRPAEDELAGLTP